MLQSAPRVLSVLFVVAAACGGKAKPAEGPAGPAGPAAADGPDQAALKAELAALPQVDACKTDDGGTLAELMAYQRGLLAGDDPNSVEETFECRRQDADPGWDCMWAVMSKPSGAPSPDDPCGGECCSGFQLMVTVTEAGTLVPDSIMCVAPG
ncbi:MAG: hypothetical protein KBG48_04455 [Kofleriaceae bacterium]|nr:hypothetical protein [Kofleriaceae bacterium]MBP9166611.1 hypothetical protein [Kofleriaceae bacterium]MBP9858469.1 hypothetical protein [Kofleriaceae bacterium]